MSSSSNPPLILASTSAYRRELLARLQLPFQCVAPQVDETPLADEAAADLALRLAVAKAQAVAQQYPDAVVIGSDQVADVDGHILGKPLAHQRTIEQLRLLRGRSVWFHTAIAVVQHSSRFMQTDIASVRTQFLSEQQGMSDAAIASYVQAEKPYDCTGGIKSEGLGIVLMAQIDNDDPTGLIGLPLMRTCALLRAAGVAILPAAQAANSESPA